MTVFLLLLAGCGRSTPEHSFRGLDDQDHELSEYLGRGKWTIVNVWSTSCPYCRMEIADLQDFHDEHKDRDATVLGIAIGFPDFDYPDPQVVKDYTSDYFIDFPSLLADAEQASLIVDHEITLLPMTFFFDPDGKLAGRWEGMISLSQIERIIHNPSKESGLYGSGSRGFRN